MRPPVPRLRLAAILCVAAFLMFGPFWVQVLHKPTGVHRSWQMYSGAGRDNCVADFYRVRADGTLRPLDRAAVLYDGRPWWERTFRERRLLDVTAVRREAQRMCGALRGEAVDVRVDARCGSRTRWVPAIDTDEVICGTPPARRQR